MSTAAPVFQFKTDHVGLNVSDLERSKRFYRGVFDWVVMGESKYQQRPFAFLGDGTNVLVTLWQQSEGRFHADRPGLHHLAFEVASIDEVRQAEQRVRALDGKLFYDGIVPHGERSKSAGIFFEDPDGIRLEISSPAGASGPAPVPGAPTCGFF